MEILKKHLPLLLKILGGLIIFAAFGGLMEDFPYSLPMTLCMIALGVLLIFPSLLQDRIKEAKNKKPLYIGAIILLFLGAALSTNLLTLKPILSFTVPSSVEWNEDNKRYETLEENITITFTPHYPENAQGYYIEEILLETTAQSTKHPLKLQEGENRIHTTVVDYKGRKIVKYIDIFYTSPNMLAKAEEEEALQKEKEAQEAEQREQEKANQLKTDLQNGIDAYNQGTALWEEAKLAEMITEGKTHSEPSIQSLAQKLQIAAVGFQAKDFPKQRTLYAKELGQRLWEDDYEVKVSGASKDILTVIHWSFASNNAIKDFHTDHKKQFYKLRFSQIRYMWFDGSEYRYFDLETLSDKAIEGVE